MTDSRRAPKPLLCFVLFTNYHRQFQMKLYSNLRNSLVFSVSTWALETWTLNSHLRNPAGPLTTAEWDEAYNKNEMYCMWQKQGPPQHTAPYLSSDIVEIYCVLLSLINIIYCFPPQCSLCICTHSVQTVLCIRGVQTLSSNQSTDVIVSLESPTAVQASRTQHGNQWPETYEGVSSSTGTFTVYPRGWFLLKLTDINIFCLLYEGHIKILKY